MGFFSNNKDKKDTFKPEEIASLPYNDMESVIPVSKLEPSNPIPKISQTVIPDTKPNTFNPISNIQKPMTTNMTIITAGTIIEGQIKVDTDIQIDGTVKGTITSKNKVILGVNSKLEGDINCQEAEISGKVVGKINVKEILFLKGAASVDGDIVTGKLVMESGVKFNGKCNMTGIPNATATPTTAPPPAASANPMPSTNTLNVPNNTNGVTNNSAEANKLNA
jgi:cytoskeletal protein CcmA (bactofilin family)